MQRTQTKKMPKTDGEKYSSLGDRLSLFSKIVLRFLVVKVRIE